MRTSAEVDNDGHPSVHDATARRDARGDDDVTRERDGVDDDDDDRAHRGDRARGASRDAHRALRERVSHTHG